MIESSLSTSIHLHHDSDDERMEEVIDKLTNVTIGDNIDESKSVFDNIMLVLGGRKQKKLACNKDALKKIFLQRFGIDENTFSRSLGQLVSNGLISEHMRGGLATTYC